MRPIVVAPFSNSHIRDWPVGHFARLIGELVDRWESDAPIRVIGTRNQMLRAAEIVRRFDATRVLNDCGHMAWPDVLEMIRTAACVIGNNSGVAHVAGSFGVPTVCVFGGSHQRLEWRPLGFNVIVVSRVIGCSPCQLDHGQDSYYDKACLREIDPKLVADSAFEIMERVRRASADREIGGDRRMSFGRRNGVDDKVALLEEELRTARAMVASLAQSLAAQDARLTALEADTATAALAGDETSTELAQIRNILIRFERQRDQDVEEARKVSVGLLERIELRRDADGRPVEL